jgi:hypothetical protein
MDRQSISKFVRELQPETPWNMHDKNFMDLLIAFQSRVQQIQAAQHSVQLTALRRGLAVSIFINLVLLAVVLFTIGGN